MATLALNSLSYLLRIVVVYAPFLVSGRLSIHSILLRFYVQILGLIIRIGSINPEITETILLDFKEKLAKLGRD